MKVLLALILLLAPPPRASARPADAHAGAFEALLEGNRRFCSGRLLHPDQTRARVIETREAQHPVAAVLGCSDSRVPPEIVFDQGVGDLFVVREAGNVVDDDVLGSLEYAVEHLHVKLIVVLGHKGCGAVAAALKHEKGGHIGVLIGHIEPSLAGLSADAPGAFEKAVRANVEHSMAEILRAQPVLARKAASGEIRVVGALYDVATGKVEVLR